MLGEDHPEIARCMCKLGLLYQNQKRYEVALPLFEKALAIYREKLGPEHPWTKGTQRNYEEMLRLMEEKK